MRSLLICQTCRLRKLGSCQTREVSELVRKTRELRELFVCQPCGLLELVCQTCGLRELVCQNRGLRELVVCQTRGLCGHLVITQGKVYILLCMVSNISGRVGVLWIVQAMKGRVVVCVTRCCQSA